MYEMDLKTRNCRRIVFRDGSRQIDSFILLTPSSGHIKMELLFCDEMHGVFEIKEGSLVADPVIPYSKEQVLAEFALVEDRYIFLQHGGALPNFTFENKNGKWIKTPHLLDSLNWTFMLYNKKDQTLLGQPEK